MVKIRELFIGIITALMIVFCVTVFAQAVCAGEATLQWEAPTHNTDGSELTDLAGYEVHRAFSNLSTVPYDQFTDVKDLGMIASDADGLAEYIYTNQPNGVIHYFIKAYNATGKKSDPTNRGKKFFFTIPDLKKTLIVK